MVCGHSPIPERAKTLSLALGAPARPAVFAFLLHVVGSARPAASAVRAGRRRRGVARLVGGAVVFRR